MKSAWKPIYAAALWGWLCLGLPFPALAQEALPADSTFIASPLFRWLVAGGLIVFLLKKLVSFFSDKANDEFATLSSSYRWVFPAYQTLIFGAIVVVVSGVQSLIFAATLLMTAGSLRRYYCDGHFVNNPWALKLHILLRLLLLWLAWSPELRIWWLILAPVPVIQSAFYNVGDVAEHRGAFFIYLAGLITALGIGAAAGYAVIPARWIFTPTTNRVLLGMLLGSLPMVYFFARWQRRVFCEFINGMLYDIIFAEGAFAEKARIPQPLPSTTLLQHWRESGELDKTWKESKSHLVSEARALPIWLFAIETAILFRRKPQDAIRILDDLYDNEAFPYDHRVAAVVKTQEWMKDAGFPFDPQEYRVEKPIVDCTGLADSVEGAIRSGQFRMAERLLKDTLKDDPLNELAFMQLVRLYAQDFKAKRRAEQTVASADASGQFGPKLIEFLRDSIADWMKLPPRSKAKFNWLVRLFRKDVPPRKKLALTPARPQSEAEEATPVDAYLQRLEAVRAAKPAKKLKTPKDQIERLLQENRLGTAVEVLKDQAEKNPGDFSRWLRYADAQGNHCGNIFGAERILKKMAASGHFKKAQMQRAYRHLQKWKEKHPMRRSGWG